MRPYLNGFPEQAITPFYLLFSLFVAVSAYYLIKLFVFYKRLNKTALNTKDNLYETYFDIRLNMELYKTFGFALTPFMILFLVGVLYFTLPNGATLFTDSTNSIALFVSVLFSMLFIGRGFRMVGTLFLRQIRQRNPNRFRRVKRRINSKATFGLLFLCCNHSELCEFFANFK